MSEFSSQIETSLLILANSVLPEKGVSLESYDYQKIAFRIYDSSVVDKIMKKFKFKDVGNVYDHDTIMPQPEIVEGVNIATNYDRFQRICLSKKINSILFYTANPYSISCTFMVDLNYIEKFARDVKVILQEDSQSDIFKDLDFECGKREYIEVADPTGDEMKAADVFKKKVPKETMVFEEGSTITDVMHDISTFFKKDTKALYEKMQIAYKRGIILWGDPGNGKSAMIRELIRRIPHVSKIVINPNVSNVTKILSSLISSLSGKQAIIIIEDIDSLINSRNRSEFLNILDGVNINSGVYFIGTTNYPESIDPAFMNRSGRFDMTFEIKNPDEVTRRAFFESRNIAELLSEYKTFKDDQLPQDDVAVVELFTKNTADLPMASLKEVMTGTRYLLAGNPDMSVEEATEAVYKKLTENKSEHNQRHEKFMNTNDRSMRRPRDARSLEF